MGGITGTYSYPASNSYPPVSLSGYLPSGGSSVIPGYTPPAVPSPPSSGTAAGLVSELLPGGAFSAFSGYLTSEIQSDPTLQVGLANTLDQSWMLQNSLTSYRNMLSFSATLDALGSNLNIYL